LFIIIDISTDPKAIRGPDIQEILANMDKKTQLPLSRRWIEECIKTGQIVDMEPYLLKLSSPSTNVTVAPASSLSEDSEMDVIDLTIDEPNNAGQERPPDTSIPIVEPKPWSPFVPKSAKNRAECTSTDCVPTLSVTAASPQPPAKKTTAPTTRFIPVARPTLYPEPTVPYLVTRGLTPPPPAPLAEQRQFRTIAPKSVTRKTSTQHLQQLIDELDYWLRQNTKQSKSVFFRDLKMAVSDHAHQYNTRRPCIANANSAEARLGLEVDLS
jgi:hypothetical protein